jgi:RES domain-containing protein
MVRDRELLDLLDGFSVTGYSGKVFRVTRQGLNATTPATGGGRWMVKDGMAVLYTSLEDKGAMSEVAFHLAQLTPPPSKAMVLHELEVDARRLIRMTRRDFPKLGISEASYGSVNYARCQVIGDAASFLNLDALLVPCARWDCENLVVLHENYVHGEVRLVQSREFDWQAWARERQYL